MCDMDEELKRQIKQRYLRTNIIEKTHDSDQFITYLLSITFLILLL